MRRLALILPLFMLARLSFAQPAPREQWAHTWGENINDLFRDLYITEAGNFAITGRKQMDEANSGDGWLVLTNPEARDIFERHYGENGNMEDFWTLIEVEGGGYLMGGDRNTPGIFTALRVDADGDPIWWNDYGGDQHSRCYAVIELKAGDFVLAGWSAMGVDTIMRGDGNGYVCKINRDGDLIWEWAYGGVREDAFHAMRETEDGVLLVGYKGEDAWLCMIDDESGEFIWERTYNRDDMIREHGDVFNNLISCREGGFLVVGYDYILDEDLSWPWVMRVNNEGERIWEQTYDLHENCRSRNFFGVQQLPDEGFAMVGPAGQNGAQMLRTDRDGEILWERLYPPFEQDWRPIASSYLTTVLLTGRNELVACGSGRVLHEQGTGLLLKLRPERSAPMIIRQYPDTLDCTFLTGDTVLFDVDAVDLQNDSILYQWRLERAVISTDTCTTITFNQSGTFTLECWVSDGELADSADWQIKVSDLFIYDYTPDRLDLRRRRGATVNFSLDSVAAVAGDPVQYSWTLTDLDNQNVTDEGAEPRAAVEFLRSGNYQMEGVASRGESWDNVIWTIQVRSSILDFWPRELNLTVPADSSCEFGVIPFDPASESLSYLWEVNGDSVGGDSTVLLRFAWDGQAGNPSYRVKATLMDGAAGDSVSWQVTVRDPDEVGKSESQKVEKWGILSASPNPFNNSTTICFTVPSASASTSASLTLHDLTGRELARLVEGRAQQAGLYAVTLDGRNLPAGIYLLKLEAGGRESARKIVLMK